MLMQPTVCIDGSKSNIKTHIKVIYITEENDIVDVLLQSY
jgi:hypothetical protein